MHGLLRFVEVRSRLDECGESAVIIVGILNTVFPIHGWTAHAEIGATRIKCSARGARRTRACQTELSDRIARSRDATPRATHGDDSSGGTSAEASPPQSASRGRTGAAGGAGAGGCGSRYPPGAKCALAHCFARRRISSRWLGGSAHLVSSSDGSSSAGFCALGCASGFRQLLPMAASGQRRTPCPGQALF